MSAAHWIQRTHLFRADEFICSACHAVSRKPYKQAEGLSAVSDDDW